MNTTTNAKPTTFAAAHLEALLASMPRRQERDPFALRPMGQFAGMNIIESPDRPRYTLPAEAAPGVPWPPGFRDSFNRWSTATLGTVNNLPKGTVYVLDGTHMVMRPSDVAMISNIV
jgi:hypothetical protein